jgi:hypothetical protein
VLESDADALARHLMTPLEALRRAVDVQEIGDDAISRALVTGVHPARLGLTLDPERTTALVAGDLLLAVVGQGQDGPQHLVWSQPGELDATS